LYARRDEEEKMKKLLVAVPFAVFLFAGCVLPGPRGPVVVVPALPSVVVLEEEPYYYQSGYHYNYRGDRWYYSNSRNGPWAELPRDRYPNEVRHKGRGYERGRGEKRGHDDRDRN
jgi:hypothetical protein